jgi:voltage-gated potassium channel
LPGTLESHRMHVDVEKRFEVWYERLTLPRAVATVIAVAFTLVLLFGALARIIEPDTFTSLGLSYWWAVVTVTTVGYGDIVPESSAGRIVGTLLMLTGLGLIPTLTSVVVTTLVGKRTRAQQEQLDQQARDHAAALDRIEAHLARMGPNQTGGTERQG